MRQWIDISERLDEGAMSTIIEKTFDAAVHSLAHEQISQPLAELATSKIKQLTGKDINIDARYGVLIVAAYKVLKFLRMGPEGLIPGVADAVFFLARQRAHA